MEDSSTCAAVSGRRDGRLIGLLLLLALGMRAWQLTHTEVAARDSIGYIRIAWQLGHQPWKQVLPSAAQHPLYSLTVLAVSYPVCAAVPDLAVGMQLSAQLASALASVLLVLPMFLLGRDLFDRRIGFWGALLFQTLPASGRLMADGLSEPLFLLLTASALLCCVRALRGSRPLWYALTGLFSGLAYLTRPEGAMTMAATALVLLVAQAVRRWRRPWLRCLSCAAVLTATMLAVTGPYMWTIGNVTVKPSARRVFEQMGAPQPVPPAPTVSRSILAIWDGYVDLHAPSTRVGWGVRAVAQELATGFFFVGWVPALVGLVRQRRLFLREQGAWVLVLIGVGVTISLYAVAVVVGYASDRHLLLVLLGGCYWLVAGVDELAAGLAVLLRRLRRDGPETAPVLATLTLALLSATAGVKSLERLHGDRGGFRQAGRWLAEHTAPGDTIDDPYAWAHYYAGRVFDEVTPRAQPAGRPVVRYIVLEESLNSHSHLLQATEAAKRAHANGVPVQRWQVPRGQVVIYEVSVPPSP